MGRRPGSPAQAPARIRPETRTACNFCQKQEVKLSPSAESVIAVDGRYMGRRAVHQAGGVTPLPSAASLVAVGRRGPQPTPPHDPRSARIFFLAQRSRRQSTRVAGIGAVTTDLGPLSRTVGMARAGPIGAGTCNICPRTSRFHPSADGVSARPVKIQNNVAVLNNRRQSLEDDVFLRNLRMVVKPTSSNPRQVHVSAQEGITRQTLWSGPGRQNPCPRTAPVCAAATSPAVYGVFFVPARLGW